MDREGTIAFRIWFLEYLHYPTINEHEYYLAPLAAERLLVQGIVTEMEFVLMIQASNTALEKWKSETPDEAPE